MRTGWNENAGNAFYSPVPRFFKGRWWDCMVPVILLPFLNDTFCGIYTMRLTSHTDFALRVLLYVGAAGKTVTITQISEAYGISKEHLRKVVHSLSQLGYLKTTQGRNGGITLAMLPDLINIRKVVDQLENSNIVECFDSETSTCAIDGMCLLKKALMDARNSFMQVLEQYCLSDMISNQELVAFCRQ